MTQPEEQTAEQGHLPNLQGHLQEWSADLDILRQNQLLNEGQFISFVRERGLPIKGVVTGDPGKFHKRGWLMSDGLDYKGHLLFHPFRQYPLHEALEADNIGSSILAPSTDEIRDVTIEKNKVTDLAILLEPLYWPVVTGHLRRSGYISQGDFTAHRRAYQQKVIELVQTLDVGLWEAVHTRLRIDAATMDRNDELYLLLRLSTWEQRKKLTGSLAGALWLRHMAEVIRRAFEEVHSLEWLEEDQAFGTWHPGGRKSSFGSERPLDDEDKSKPYLAFSYGLFTGSAVRWYVEGDTEFYSITHTILEPSGVGIELINLRGNIEAGRDNAALKVNDWLKEDKALRRFSMVSLDLDVSANVKFVKRQVEQGNIVGYIAAHKPDFEFANFSVQELAEIAAVLDESHGTSGTAVREADWTGINNGRAFEDRYKLVSSRKPRGLKGKEWGEALAAYANSHPNRSDTGEERMFWREIRAALQGRIADYDFQQEIFVFDPETFELVDLRFKRRADALTTPPPLG